MPQCVAASEPVRPLELIEESIDVDFLGVRSKCTAAGTLGPDRGDPERNDSLRIFSYPNLECAEFSERRERRLTAVLIGVQVQILARLSESSGALCEQIQPFIFDLRGSTGRTRKGRNGP